MFSLCIKNHTNNCHFFIDYNKLYTIISKNTFSSNICHHFKYISAYITNTWSKCTSCIFSKIFLKQNVKYIHIFQHMSIYIFSICNNICRIWWCQILEIHFINIQLITRASMLVSYCFTYHLKGHYCTCPETLCRFPLPDKMTYVGQKFCMVVYPGSTGGSGGAEEGEEMKEARSPLSKEDGDNHKSADC